jgi:hypothetical protein
VRAAVSTFAVIAATIFGPAAAQQEALLADGAFEMITWTADRPDEKFRDLCTIAGGSVRCAMQKHMGNVVLASTISGALGGNRIVSRAHVRVSFSGDCSFASDVDLTGTIVLSPDGTLSNVWTGGPVTYSSFAGSCAGMPTSGPSGATSSWVGTWRQLTPAEASALTLPAPPASEIAILVTRDGKTVTIDLSQLKAGKLTVEQMELVKQYAMTAPSGGPGYTLQAFRYPGLLGKDPPVYEPMRRLDEVMAEGAIGAGTSALECAQGAASWAKANPGKASLMALGLAVSLAMPYTVAFQASAGGMTFLESAGIGFMTSATPAAVQTLVTSAMSGEGFWKSSGKAALSGGIAGVESLVSTTVGAGVTGTVETGMALTRRFVGANVSEQAVKGFGTVASGIAGSATDFGVGILHDQAADAIAAAASRTAIPDMVTPARSTPAGGIVLPILSKPVAR